MKNGVNWIENQGENWYKILQNCQMRGFGENYKSYYLWNYMYTLPGTTDIWPVITATAFCLFLWYIYICVSKKCLRPSDLNTYVALKGQHLVALSQYRSLRSVRCYWPCYWYNNLSSITTYKPSIIINIFSNVQTVC